MSGASEIKYGGLFIPVYGDLQFDWRAWTKSRLLVKLWTEM